MSPDRQPRGEQNTPIDLHPAVSDYIKSRDFVKKGHLTQGAYKTDLKQFSDFLSEHNIVDLNQVGPRDISDFLLKFNSAATVYRKLTPLKQFFSWAKDEQLIDHLPTFDLPREKEIRPFEHLTQEEASELIRVAQLGIPRVLIATALGTGARIEEILTLRAGDIRPQEEGNCQITLGEGEHERTISVSGAKAALVLNFIQDKGEGEYLFPRPKYPKEHLSRQAAWDTIRRSGKRMSKENLNPRVLRQTYIMNTHFETIGPLIERLGIDSVTAINLQKRKMLTLAQQDGSS